MVKLKNRPAIRQYIIEIFGLPQKILLHCPSIENHINKIIKLLNLKILKRSYYNFKPFGATILYVLSASHLSVHTWPENNYLHLDLFVCSSAKPKCNLGNVIKKVFKTDNFLIRQVKY